MTTVATQPQANGNGSQRLKTPVGFGAKGVEIRSLEDLFRFSDAIARSGLAPKGLETPEAILVAIQMGTELGLSPMASLQNIAVINGRPSVWGDAMLAICRASGVFDEEVFEEIVTGDKDNMSATCTVRRLPKGKAVVRTFNATDAKRAGLWDKAGPWKQYPPRMLQMRARSFALRDAFSDVLKGVTSAEEVRDTPIEVTATFSPKPSSLDDLTRQIEAKEIVREDGEIVSATESVTV